MILRIYRVDDRPHTVILMEDDKKTVRRVFIRKPVFTVGDVEVGGMCYWIENLIKEHDLIELFDLEKIFNVQQTTNIESNQQKS